LTFSTYRNIINLCYGFPKYFLSQDELYTEIRKKSRAKGEKVDRNTYYTKAYNEFEKVLEMKELTPHKVAVDIGISPVILTDWKYGRTKPKFDTLMKIAEYLNIDARLFMENR
jgi:transcriptional regulator with XRE-family HTH domain